jgi:GNAT superfamily N-acetyltransferase
MDSIESIAYGLESRLATAEFIDVLRRATLAARRPVDDPDRIARMIAAADIMVTARAASGLLIGVSRALTDWSFCCYLSDLAVDQSFQGRGIGRELIRRTQDASGPQAKLLLLAAPKAQSYYPHIGMQRHEHAYLLPSAKP